jgi:predicted nucleic acid-binding protein
MSWLLDTNVQSESRRPKPDQRVVAFLAACPLNRLFISSVTFAEIRFGIERTPEPNRRVEIERWLNQEMRPLFEGRVLQITEDVMFRWRVLVEDGRKTGRTFSQPDLIIAAIAIEHGLTLVTRNVKDFEGLGVVVLNPWNSHP